MSEDCADRRSVGPNEICPAGPTFLDAHGLPALKPVPEYPLRLAQAIPPPQITRRPGYGAVAPIGVPRTDLPTIAPPPALPAGVTPEQLRAQKAAAARRRADLSRAGNLAEEHRPAEPMGMLSATIVGWSAPIAVETGHQIVHRYQTGTPVAPGNALPAAADTNPTGGPRAKPGQVGRISSGIAGAAGVYFADSAASDWLRANGQDKFAQFMAPSKLEVAAIAGTMAAPVPPFVPGAGGPWYARLGARALWEGATDVGAKLINYGFSGSSEPEIERANLAASRQALIGDHQKKTPDSMTATIDAWKALGNYDNQIQQTLDDSIGKIDTTDPNKLAEARRDIAALYVAFGETQLEKGTRLGGKDAAGRYIGGPINERYLFAGSTYDFGGVALTSLNSARNTLNELGIPASDPVAMRVYGSLSQNDISKILNPHSDLPAISNQLATLVQNNPADAQWISTWLNGRIATQKIAFQQEESDVLGKKQRGEPFVPQFNNYVLAKLYQDQALLEMSYAAAGSDPQRHLKIAHDALAEAKRIGWDGRPIRVNGGPAMPRASDLPQLTNIYRGLGGTVDW